MDRRFQKRIAGYLAKREKAVSDHIAQLNVNGWFDFWHDHPDMKCRANRAKSMVALLTYTLLQKAEGLCKDREAPIQVWATLCENTGDNAVFLHTANPNGTPFPYGFEGVEWGVSEPPEARGLIRSSHEVGRRQYDNETVYFIRKRA